MNLPVVKVYPTGSKLFPVSKDKKVTCLIEHSSVSACTGEPVLFSHHFRREENQLLEFFQELG